MHWLIRKLGICRGDSSADPICILTVGLPADRVSAALFGQENTGATNSLVTLGLDIQQKVLLNCLLMSATFFFPSILFLYMARRIMNKRVYLAPGRDLRIIKYVTFGLAWLSTALAIIATLLFSGVINGLACIISVTGDGDMSISIGILLQTLQFAICLLLTFFSLGVMAVLGNRWGLQLTKLNQDFSKTPLFRF